MKALVAAGLLAAFTAQAAEPHLLPPPLLPSETTAPLDEAPVSTRWYLWLPLGVGSAFTTAAVIYGVMVWLLSSVAVSSGPRDLPLKQ